MDPVSTDPHHPPQFAAFPPFATNNPFAAPPLFGGLTTGPTNNNPFQAPPLPQSSAAPLPPHPSFNHPSYSDMICTAIAALNEPDGSSKQAIGRYIERAYTGLPPAHGALLTHHLKTLKNSGVLNMVKKSYKFAASPPPASVAVAAAAAAAGLEAPRSDFTSNNINDQPLSDPDPVSSAPPSQKRGRGRPPKPKPDAQFQPNGKPSWEQNDLSVSRPNEDVQTIKRPPGRPRKDGAPPNVQISGGVDIMKRRGRPPGGRAAGRQRKPKIVSAPASVFPYVSNGVKRRGRPKRVDASTSVAPPVNLESGEEVAVALGKRRGRPPKIGGVISKPMKPKRSFTRSGRPVGRPRKNAAWATRGVSGKQDASYGELKKKMELLQEKAKELANLLKAEVGNENQVVVQAIQELEALAVREMEINKPREIEEEVQAEHMEEEEDVQVNEADPEADPEGETEGQGQAQTEAEAMQEALF